MTWATWCGITRDSVASRYELSQLNGNFRLLIPDGVISSFYCYSYVGISVAEKGILKYKDAKIYK